MDLRSSLTHCCCSDLSLRNSTADIVDRKQWSYDGLIIDVQWRGWLLGVYNFTSCVALNSIVATFALTFCSVQRQFVNQLL